MARRRTSSSCRVSEKLVPWGLRRPLPVLFSLSERCAFEIQRPFYSARFLLKLVLGLESFAHQMTVRGRSSRCSSGHVRAVLRGALGDLPGPRRVAAESGCPAPAPRRKTGGAVSTGTGKTPEGPSRALGCPRPHYKPRRGGGQARPRIHVHSTRAPLHSRSRRASVPSLYTESERADGPGRKRAAYALDDGPAMLQQCYPTGTPSTRTP